MPAVVRDSFDWKLLEAICDQYFPLIPRDILEIGVGSSSHIFKEIKSCTNDD